MFQLNFNVDIVFAFKLAESIPFLVQQIHAQFKICFINEAGGLIAVFFAFLFVFLSRNFTQLTLNFPQGLESLPFHVSAQTCAVTEGTGFR